MQLWLIGLLIWQRIDRGIGREALEAISEDEDAAAAIGIDVMREKMRVTVISAALTALGGAIYGQYVMYLNPETVSGIAVSLQIVFAAIAGGVYSLFGPSVGALLTLALTEGLRVWHELHWGRQHALRHPAGPLRYLHAARHRRHVTANEAATSSASQTGHGTRRPHNVTRRSSSTTQ